MCLIMTLNGIQHCIKYLNFTEFFGVEILWKGMFSHSFHTIKLGEIAVFYVVQVLRFNNQVRQGVQIFWNLIKESLAGKDMTFNPKTNGYILS